MTSITMVDSSKACPEEVITGPKIAIARGEHMNKKCIASGVVSALMFITPVLSVTAAESRSMLEEAEAVRAPELSPLAYQLAKEAYAQHKSSEADLEAQKAINNSLTMSSHFQTLIESRDRMHAAGAREIRRDLADRAEEAFEKVVAAVEEGNLHRAAKESGNAELLTYQAEVVAAREQLTRPIARAIAEARKADGGRYAPKAFAGASEGLKQVERLVSSHPAARGQLYNESRNSIALAGKAEQIGVQGRLLHKKPAMVEEWLDSRQHDLNVIAEHLHITTDKETTDEQVALIMQAIDQMKSGYEAELADASEQINRLQGHVSELDAARSSLDEARYKLQLKRDAEAKIAQLAKLFNPDQVELFLTTDADVIIRMKAMNFPSGSTIIPTESYELLELTGKAIDLFANRAIRIEGHTDSIGNDEYNQQLSERRAMTVREYFEARFGENHREITAVGFGEDHPIANNEKAEGRRSNRRIDIVLIAPTMDTAESLPQQAALPQ
ncbi:OmpA family protein [Mariprofundus erugo]|nr:OmpA family protein [Mariprofundus erugo]